VNALPCFVLAAAALGAACTSSGAPADDQTPADIDGIAHATLMQPAPGRWSLLLFVGTDCPVSNQYAPEIRRICGDYAPAGVQCSLVYSDRQTTVGQVRTHLDAFGLGKLPALIDNDQSLAQRAGARVTPQAVVYAADGARAYSGRIDNLYVELGRPRQNATERDLRNALEDLVAGRAVRTPRTQAIGCYIE
jgi:hypothetical protein